MWVVRDHVRHEFAGMEAWAASGFKNERNKTMIGVSGELALFFLSGHVASLSAGLRKLSSVSRPRGDDGNVNVRGLAIVCEYEVHARPLSIPEHRGNDLFNEHVCAKVFLNEISETPDEVIVALDDAPACFADDAMALLCVDGRWANMSPTSPQ